MSEMTIGDSVWTTLCDSSAPLPSPAQVGETIRRELAVTNDPGRKNGGRAGSRAPKSAGVNARNQRIGNDGRIDISGLSKRWGIGP